MIFKATFNSISVKSGGLIKNKNKYDVSSNYINDYESWCEYKFAFLYVKYFIGSNTDTRSHFSSDHQFRSF